MADLIYDIDELEDAKKAIDALINDLDQCNSVLSKALGDLEQGWNTPAGKKFFTDHKDTWSIAVKKYVKKLTGISDMLQKAIDQYNKIGNEVQNLKV